MRLHRHWQSAAMAGTCSPFVSGLCAPKSNMRNSVYDDPLVRACTLANKADAARRKSEYELEI
eukprot:3014308-Rhodomonas_salina.1